MTVEFHEAANIFPMDEEHIADLAADIKASGHYVSGSQLARTLQSRLPSLPVLVISGYAESEGLESDLPRLTKPFRSDELINSLSTLGA